MILPSEFQSVSEYLNEVVLFLNKVSWIYEFAVTSLLTRDVLTNIPAEWAASLIHLSIDELNSVPTGLIKVGIT